MMVVASAALTRAGVIIALAIRENRDPLLPGRLRVHRMSG